MALVLPFSVQLFRELEPGPVECTDSPETPGAVGWDGAKDDGLSFHL